MADLQGSVKESEAELIERAQDSVSGCNWVVGECASKWTRKFARGRTDADFGVFVGLSGDQVYQRRRVWETFGDVCHEYPQLKWSHFYAALSWDDAPECLVWASENHATVAEMKAWRRLQHGEDLTASAELDDVPDELVSIIPMEPMAVRDPSAAGSLAGGRAASSGGTPSRAAGSAAATVGTAARETDGHGGNYSPFRPGAGTPPPDSESTEVAVATHNAPSAVQTVKRMTTSIERCTKVLTPAFADEFRRLPEKERNRFIRAVGELSSKAAGLLK